MIVEKRKYIDCTDKRITADGHVVFKGKRKAINATFFLPCDPAEDQAVWDRDISGLLKAGEYPPMRQVIDWICMIHKVPREMIVAARKTREIVLARHHAMYEIRRVCRPTITSNHGIARVFGDRDHTTVLYAVANWHKKAKENGIPIRPINESPYSIRGSQYKRDLEGQISDRYQDLEPSHEPPAALLKSA